MAYSTNKISRNCKAPLFRIAEFCKSESISQLAVSDESRFPRRIECTKRKFGFIKRVDKGWITTVKDLATTTTTATKTPQICIFDNGKQYFCTHYTCIFHLLTLWRRSRSFYDVKWPVLQLCGRRQHMMTNVQFCLLMPQALVPI